MVLELTMLCQTDIESPSVVILTKVKIREKVKTWLREISGKL